MRNVDKIVRKLPLPRQSLILRAIHFPEPDKGAFDMSLNRVIGIGMLALFLLAAGCATPSVHTIVTPDTRHHEPGLIGAWRQVGEDSTYVVSEQGDAYRLTATESDPSAKSYLFDVELAHIGEHYYADIQATQDDRNEVSDRFGPTFVSTHLILKWLLTEDELEIWLMDRDWVERATQVGTLSLPHTSLENGEVLITAETAALQKFLETHGGDSNAFPHRIVMNRVKP